MNNLIKEEYTNNQGLLIHFHSKQFEILKIYFSIYFAIWGGYIIALNQKIENIASNFLIFGILNSIIFLSILISNRRLQNVTRRRQDILREKFLFDDDEIWNDFPVFYKKKKGKKKNEESIEMLPIFSSFTLTLILICFSGAILHYTFAIKNYSISNRDIFITSIIVFIALYIYVFIYSTIQKRRG